MNRILLVYRHSAERAPPLAFALSQFSVLLAFADQLPAEMALENNSAADVLVFQ